MSKSQSPGGHFGALEWAIMEVLWSGGGMDVAECRRRLGENSAYTTVKTVMERLTEKDLLHRERRNRAYWYWPVESRDVVMSRLAEQDARGLIADYDRIGLASFLRVVENDQDRLDEVRQLLKRVEER